MIELMVRTLYQIIMGKISHLQVINNGILVGFRCWPIDLDINWHMNNATYFRVAELNRWRIFSYTKLLDTCARYRWNFLVVEQSAKYLRPIRPFQKYSVATTIFLTGNKYIHFKHTFQDSSSPVIYSIVMVKTVCKELNGKTVLPSQVLNGVEVFLNVETKES